MNGLVEEPQGESWKAIKDKYSQSGFFDNIWDIKELDGDVARLLSQTKREERERILKIVEGLKKPYKLPIDQGGIWRITEARIMAWNTALSDLSSRIQEEPKE